MTKIIYNPEKVGKQIQTEKGKNIIIRKYHLTEEEIARLTERWELEIREVDKEIREKVYPHFFNPFRRGIYHYQIKALYLLGASLLGKGEWHDLKSIMNKLEEIMSFISCSRYPFMTEWDIFRGKLPRKNSMKSKDEKGRVQENMLLLQRLGRLHPYGYKLRQACAAIDLKIIQKKDLLLYFYRLSSYPTFEEALPIRDFEEFDIVKYNKKGINKKFIGTIYTNDGPIINKE